MKKLSFTVAFLLMNFSTLSHGSEYTEPEETDIYDGMEFDFNLDFFHQEAAAKLLNAISDKFWRFLGYDSNAYITAKRILRDPAQRIELALSLLAIDKFPDCDTAADCLDMLMAEELSEEILPKEIHRKVTSIGYSTRFEDVHDIVSSLSKNERMIIATNMQEDEPLISPNGLLTTLSDDEVSTLSLCLRMKFYDLLNAF